MIGMGCGEYGQAVGKMGRKKVTFDQIEYHIARRLS